jgi:hypothetical protein
MASQWTARKDVCEFISIHPMPVASKETFILQHRQVMEALVALPIVQEKFLSFTQVCFVLSGRICN